MAINANKHYRTIGRNGQPVDFAYPMSSKELQNLLSLIPDSCKVALLVLTPFEPPRDGSSGPDEQYPTGWALHHLRSLLRQYGQECFISELRLLHEYLLAGGKVNNPIGLFTYRMRLNPISVGIE